MTNEPKPSTSQVGVKPEAKANTPYALLGVLLTLYFAQGLPAGFITQALPAILREYDVSLEMIGLSGLLLVPCSSLHASLLLRQHSTGFLSQAVVNGFPCNIHAPSD